MANDSFDPKQWLSGSSAQPGSSDPSAAKSANDGTDFWRISLPDALAKEEADLSTSSAQVKSSSKSSDLPAGLVPGRVALAALLSAAILAAAAAGAWFTRQPAAEVAAPVAEATQGSGIEERALNLSGIGQLAAALTSAGVRPAEANAAAAAAAGQIAGSGEIRAILVLRSEGGTNVLQQLNASLADGSGVVLTRLADGSFASQTLAADLTREVKVLRGEIDSESFYTSAVSAGLVDALIPEFINAFGYDFNLASEVTPGDVFEVAYDQAVNGRGEPIGPPKLLYGQLTTKTKSLALYRFEPVGSEAGWFDGNGASTKRGLMRTPVDGARISSNFGMRFHPVLHYTRLHAGVDFAVPVGTPVYAAAAGVVIGSHPTGCGGNMAVVRHDNGWVTRYFHLSKFADGLYEGLRIPQGFTLGLSGTTGTCTTGPHLHYEVRINDEPVDPLTVPTDDSKRDRLAGANLTAFMKERDRIDVARAKGSD